MDGRRDPLIAIDYARDRSARRRLAWRILRRVLYVASPLFLYAAIYLTVARRSFMWGGGFEVKYPGLVRFYALTPKMAASLGREDELVEWATDQGTTVDRDTRSLRFIEPGAWHQMWRVFYAAERVDLACRGGAPVPIAYAVPVPIPVPPSRPVDAASMTAAPPLPYVGASYREWFVRDGTLYRFVEATYAARGPSNALARQNDAYLFEWDLADPWNALPRPAKRVRRVESSGRATWDAQWLIDADHFITWNANTGETRLVACGTSPSASPFASIKSLKKLLPVRCNRLNPITVSPTARYLIGESDGLAVYRADTLELVRRVPEDAAALQFFASRADELDAANSECHLMDDGVRLLRVVTQYKKVGDKFVNGTIVVVWNIETGKVADFPVRVGVRADVKSAAMVDGKLMLYLCYTDGNAWRQCLYDPQAQRKVDLHPANAQTDSVPMGWDPPGGLLVDLPGFPANPQALPVDSDVSVERLGSTPPRRGVVRYGDAAGTPKLFAAGKIALDAP